MWVGMELELVDGLCSTRMTFRADLGLILSHRLYTKGRVLGHKRGKRNTRPNTSLLQIEGVATKEDAQFYLGKVRV
jgi:hypothetical protein